MTRRWLGLTGALLGLAAAALVADRKIEMKDLPPAVQKAVQEQTKDATLKGLSKEVEGGKTFYEAETTRRGRSRDLTFDATGRLVEVEEEIPIDEVPAAVRRVLEARGKVLKVESVTKGNSVTYEAQVEKNGKKSEVDVDADGKTLKP